MRLVVFSHKVCWPSPDAPAGFATDGGFAFQMAALSELFDETVLLIPCAPGRPRAGEVPLHGDRLRVVPLTEPPGSGLLRKALLPVWVLRHARAIIPELGRADGVHAPIPGDVGTIGMLLAVLSRKPLFVRHCGNWAARSSFAAYLWHFAMERLAGGRNVMLATGGDTEPPSRRSPAVAWIFSTSLRADEMRGVAPRSGGPGDPPSLVVSGRLDAGKGIDRLLAALPGIAEDFPGARLTIVGDGPLKASLQRQSEQLGIADRVTFTGRVSHEQVLEHLQAADLFCLPTAGEGFPKAVLEGLAMGLPVVTTPVSVLPTLVEGAGVLLTGTDPDSIRKAVVGVLSDRVVYAEMSARAIATASGYTLERWRDEIGEHLRRAWGPLRS